MSTYIYARRAETLTRHLRPMPDLLPPVALPRRSREQVAAVRALAIRRVVKSASSSRPRIDRTSPQTHRTTDTT